jgi:hypothetical protein
MIRQIKGLCNECVSHTCCRAQKHCSLLRNLWPVSGTHNTRPSRLVRCTSPKHCFALQPLHQNVQFTMASLFTSLLPGWSKTLGAAPTVAVWNPKLLCSHSRRSACQLRLLSAMKAGSPLRTGQLVCVGAGYKFKPSTCVTHWQSVQSDPRAMSWQVAGRALSADDYMCKSPT